MHPFQRGRAGTESPVVDCLPASFLKGYVETVRRAGLVMLEWSLTARFNASKAGKHGFKVLVGMPGNELAALNVYANGQRQLSANGIVINRRDNFLQEIERAALALNLKT